MVRRKNISTSLNMRFFSKGSIIIIIIIIIILADHADYADLFHNHLPRLQNQQEDLKICSVQFYQR
jgi:hypothetical protein